MFKKARCPYNYVQLAKQAFSNFSIFLRSKSTGLEAVLRSYGRLTCAPYSKVSDKFTDKNENYDDF